MRASGACGSGDIRPWISREVGSLRDDLQVAVFAIFPEDLDDSECRFLDRAVLGAAGTRKTESDKGRRGTGCDLLKIPCEIRRPVIGVEHRLRNELILKTGNA